MTSVRDVDIRTEKKQLVVPVLACHLHCLYNQLQTVIFHTVDDSLTFKIQEPKNKKRPRHNVCTRHPWIPVSKHCRCFSLNVRMRCGCGYVGQTPPPIKMKREGSLVPRPHPQEEERVWFYARPGYEANSGIRDTIEKSGTVPEIPGQLEPMLTCQ